MNANAFTETEERWARQRRGWSLALHVLMRQLVAFLRRMVGTEALSSQEVGPMG